MGDQLEPFSNFFERLPYAAQSFPCPQECGCAHEVIPCDDGSIIAACRCHPPDCDDFSLTPDDIILWRLDQAKLERALCKTFGLDSKVVNFDLHCTAQIGSWSADAVPVILTIQWNPHEFRAVIAELALRLEKPFILLAPTSAHLDAHCQELLNHAGAELFPLETHVTLTQ